MKKKGEPKVQTTIRSLTSIFHNILIKNIIFFFKLREFSVWLDGKDKAERERKGRELGFTILF